MAPRLSASREAGRSCALAAFAQTDSGDGRVLVQQPDAQITTIAFWRSAPWFES
jgi:hypothetical protein